MTLTQLSYAVALADHGHFGRAAAACFVSQPTLSAQLQKLEAELDVLLFDRSVQPVRPTPRGAQVVAQARLVLAERDRLLASLADEGPIAGELRLGVIPTLAAYLLPLVVEPLGAQHPALVLRIEEYTTATLLDHLTAGHLDAGLVATEVSRPGVAVQMLFQEPFVAYVHPAHPLAAQAQVHAADLGTARLWLLTEGHCLRDQALQLCQRAQPPAEHSVRFESGNLETLRHLVDRVGGLTLLPLLATYYLDGPAAAQVRAFVPPTPHREVRLVAPRASVKQRLLAAFATVVQHTVAPLLPAADPP